jgi:hypothetical protein
MGRTTKLVLDIVIGAVIPIVVLNYLTEPLGAVPAYLLAALIPVAWVFIDLLFITRRFNFITSYTGAQAIMRGLLAFWFVDGWQFALKDTAGSILACLVFAVSIGLGRPMMELFWRQSLAPDTAAREEALNAITAERGLRTALAWGTAAILVANIGTAVANFVLNLNIVTDPFGTDVFNQQVARVNAITRIALTIPELIAFGVAFWLLWNAISKVLKRDMSGQTMDDSDDFWKILEDWRAVSQGRQREPVESA